mmetsp:Transcript_33595/g.49310  ORF Transcript_33595/g.49310 Transcript_33595/m.49310 type:complete len:178 (-) Transcript_33595:387-920(-)
MNKLVGRDTSDKLSSNREDAESTAGTNDEVIIEVQGIDGCHASTEKRKTVHAETKSDVLARYKGNPNPKKKIIPKKTRKCFCTCYTLRKWMGCALVDLHAAILKGDIQAASKTLNRLSTTNPPKINEYCKNGTTALSLATKVQDVGIVELFAEAKDCDVGRQDRDHSITQSMLALWR